MIKTINTNKSPTRKTIKIFIIILLTPVILILLGILLYFGTKPIFDKFDQDKFTTLDTQMQSLYQKVKTASNGEDEWKYAAVCSEDTQNWMASGIYDCITSISTRKTITSVQELNDLQTKYYPIVENSDIWSKHDAASTKSAGDFGKKFSVSLAYNDYVERKTEIKCGYQIQLAQTNKNTNNETDNNNLGSAIIGNQGEFFISLRCDGTARNHWYKLVKSTSEIIP